MIKEIKYFFQRAKRGYDDTDCWDVGAYFARTAPAMIRKLKKGCGCPSDFFDGENKNNECARWHEALEEMAQGFEAANYIQNFHAYKMIKQLDGTSKYETDQAAFDNAAKKMEAGLALFAKNFLALWD